MVTLNNNVLEQGIITQKHDLYDIVLYDKYSTLREIAPRGAIVFEYLLKERSASFYHQV